MGGDESGNGCRVRCLFYLTQRFSGFSKEQRAKSIEERDRAQMSILYDTRIPVF